MRLIIVTACVLSMLATTVPAQDGALTKSSDKLTKTLSVGAKVPGQLTMTDTKGNKTSFKDLRDKVVVVTFWSDSCPYLRAAEPKLKKIHADYAAKGVEMVTIAANQYEIADKDAGYKRLNAHIAKNKVNFAVYPDHGNKITDLFGARTTPHCYVIGKDGILAYAGALDDDPRGSKGLSATTYVRDAVDQLLDSGKVAVAKTKPYG